VINKWQTMTDDFVRRLEAVRCPLEEFVRGLEVACDALQERLDLARDEESTRPDAGKE